MSDEFPGISKDTYMSAKGSTQDGLTYDIFVRMHSCMEEQGARVTTLENDFRSKKKRDTVLTGTMALVGGFVAFLIQTAIFKKLG